MVRNLKTLGVAVVAMLAMSAVVASAASANLKFHAAQTHTILTGSQTTQHVFQTNTGTVTCSTATFSGTQQNATATEITIAPNYDNCIAFGFVSVPVHENGCHYLFTYDKTVHLQCPTKPIEITAPGCTVTVGTQTISPVDFNNNAAKTDVTVVATVGNIQYTNHDEGFVCTGGQFTGGKYTGSTTVTGEDTNKNPVAIWYE